MIALIAAAFLSLSSAKGAIVKYETAYWRKTQPTAQPTTLRNCKRRSNTRVKCEALTIITQRGERVRFTTTPEAILLKHGIIKVHPGGYGFIEQEKELQ